MVYYLAYYFLIFFIFSMFGYLCEVISVSIIDKRINLNRGYFIGPYLPIFGFGSLLIILLLKDYNYDYIVLFILGMFLCVTLEYVTSYLLEKIFGLRWWDYSDKTININGRVSINTGLLFGLGTIFVLWITNDYLIILLDKIPNNILIIISSVLFIIFVLDFLVSTSIIVGLKNNRDDIIKSDNTEEIRKVMSEKISKHLFLYKRFIDAFPRIRLDDEVFAKINRYLERKRKKGKLNEQ